ncbi:unnamed protein product [Amoebophrya sp. A120]|nr:unnamed protein product [Amoebophrya sp. A120]|eukprot:GSA120T00011225001.1
MTTVLVERNENQLRPREQAYYHVEVEPAPDDCGSGSSPRSSLHTSTNLATSLNYQQIARFETTSSVFAAETVSVLTVAVGESQAARSVDDLDELDDVDNAIQTEYAPVGESVVALPAPHQVVSTSGPRGGTKLGGQHSVSSRTIELRSVVGEEDQRAAVRQKNRPELHQVRDDRVIDLEAQQEDEDEFTFLGSIQTGRAGPNIASGANGPLFSGGPATPHSSNNRGGNYMSGVVPRPPPPPSSTGIVASGSVTTLAQTRSGTGGRRGGTSSAARRGAGLTIDTTTGNAVVGDQHPQGTNYGGEDVVPNNGGPRDAPGEEHQEQQPGDHRHHHHHHSSRHRRGTTSRPRRSSSRNSGALSFLHLDPHLAHLNEREYALRDRQRFEWKRFFDARVADVVPDRVWQRCGPFLQDWWTEYPLWLSLAVDVSTGMVLSGVVLGCLYLSGALGHSEDDSVGEWVLPAILSLTSGGVFLHVLLIAYNRERFSVLMILARDYYEGSRLESVYLSNQALARNRDGSPMAGAEVRRFDAYRPHCMAVSTVGNPVFPADDEENDSRSAGSSTNSGLMTEILGSVPTDIQPPPGGLDTSNGGGAAVVAGAATGGTGAVDPLFPNNRSLPSAPGGFLHQHAEQASVASVCSTTAAVPGSSVAGRSSTRGLDLASEQSQILPRTARSGEDDSASVVAGTSAAAFSIAEFPATATVPMTPAVVVLGQPALVGLKSKDSGASTSGDDGKGGAHRHNATTERGNRVDHKREGAVEQVEHKNQDSLGQLNGQKAVADADAAELARLQNVPSSSSSPPILACSSAPPDRNLPPPTAQDPRKDTSRGSSSTDLRTDVIQLPGEVVPVDEDAPPPPFVAVERGQDSTQTVLERGDGERQESIGAAAADGAAAPDESNSSSSSSTGSDVTSESRTTVEDDLDPDEIADGEILAIRHALGQPIVPVPPRIGGRIAPSWEPGTKKDADLL